MQIKHTFLFTFVLGLIWTGYLFAYAFGPEPARNGVFGSGQTCATSGCHTGNAVNASGGSLTLSGLPDTGWTPGQTYPLTVTIQRPGAILFGFQLSAVADAANQQAGTLTPGHARVKIICGRGTAPGIQEAPCSTAGAIQYAEHSNAQTVTSAYLVNWTAPSSASAGTVRFNVAGNAANGDFTSQGDFIYTLVARLDPAAVPPPPPPGVTTLPFTVVDRGGWSVITDGSGDITAGYSRIQPDAGKTTPAGVAIFGLRQGGVLVSEAGVPASRRLTSARIYGEVTDGGIVNTGLAIANPNDQAATINFHFTDESGADFGAGVLTLGANEKKAQLLNEAPFSVLSGRNPFRGTFSFTSDVEVSVVALRGLINERGEFLITTLPITDPSAPPASGTVNVPYFADGGGNTTQTILVNPTDSTIAGTVQFWDQGSMSSPAAPLTVTANGQTSSSFNYSIPRRSSFRLLTAGTTPSPLTGSVRITPSTGAAPSTLVVFSYKPAGITVTEAGAPGIQGSAFRMYVEQTAAVPAIGVIKSGFAITNLSAAESIVNLELSALDGTSASPSEAVTVPANGQVVGFLNEKFSSLALPFKGILRISGGGAAGLSVVGIRGRYNERGDFLITTTPPTDEASPPSSAEFIFPRLVTGGGATTQFILFSGAAGQSSSGNLKFFKETGAPFSLTVN